jgi:hypothetical protein
MERMIVCVHQQGFSKKLFKSIIVEIELRSFVLLLDRYKSSFSSQVVNTFYVFALCARGKMIKDSRTTVLTFFLTLMLSIEETFTDANEIQV